MFYQIKSYIKFFIKSSNQHGVHSPFVYQLITQCFYDKKKYPEYLILKNFRKKLLNSNDTIQISDFGEGSRFFKSNDRPVAAIAKHVGISQKRQELLFRLVRYFKPTTILELGTSLGLATIALAKGNPDANIITVEGCINTAKKAQCYFDDFNLENIQLHSKTFKTFFSETVSETGQLIYIDGNHNKEKTLEYFNILLKHAKNDSIFIFDDIYWSPSMTQAWQEIIKHPKVTLSIDTFYWGVVFFRKEQPKQHFNIRL